MQVPLAMTIIGKDRTGLVESVAKIVAGHGGNWLESRMCRLGGHFAGILRIHVPSENQSALTASLNALQSQGLSVVVFPDQPDTPLPAGRTAGMEIVGHDRPGIVLNITHALAGQGVNVEELSSECVSAPMSGEILFKAQARLHAPAGCNLAALRKELEKIASDLMVDVSFTELEQK